MVVMFIVVFTFLIHFYSSIGKRRKKEIEKKNKTVRRGKGKEEVKRMKKQVQEKREN